VEGSAYRGPEGARKFWLDIADSYDELTTNYEKIRDLGDAVLALGRLRGRSKEGFPVDMEYAVLMRYRDGLVVWGRSWFSHAEALEAARPDTVATGLKSRRGAEMHARVATFTGEPAMAERAIEAIRGQVEADWESPPEGLETAKELLVLVDREGGTGLGITLFETEEDLRRGDDALNAMSPADPEATGSRTDVSVYEVVVHKER
jgi:hypothetical protein